MTNMFNEATSFNRMYSPKKSKYVRGSEIRDGCSMNVFQPLDGSVLDFAVHM